MRLSDVYLVTERIKRVPPRSLDALEKALGTPLPLGYRDYLTCLGVGRFSRFLSVYPPQQVREQLGWWRETLADVVIDGMEVGMYKRGGLSAKKVREAFVVAHTDNGDQFVSTPSCGQTLFVIPRGSPSIRTLPRGLLDPMACCRAVGVPDVQPWFEAQNGRRRLSNFLVRGGAPAIEKALAGRWGSREIRRFQVIDASCTVDFGVQAIEGLVTVYGGSRGGHVVTVSHDKDFTGEVRAFVKAVGMPRKDS